MKLPFLQQNTWPKSKPDEPRRAMTGHALNAISHAKREGGEVGPMDDDVGHEPDDNNTLIDHCVSELMTAIRADDKETAKEALHVLIGEMLRKYLSDEME